MTTTPATVEPIHDLDIEVALIGAVLAGAPNPPDLRPDHFYRREHALIFDAVLAVVNTGDPVNELSVIHNLRGSGNLERVGGAAAVSAFTDALPDVANVEYYSGRVIEDATKRELQRIGGRLLRGEPFETVRPELERIENRVQPAGTGAVWRSLREYDEHPELMQPPEEVIPNLAFRGRLTLLAAREKIGKSTYAAFNTALRSKALPGGVVWVNLEEAPFDVVNRFGAFGADPDRILISEHLPDKPRDLEAVIAERHPDLVVIDTLAAWGAERISDWNSAAQVTPVMLELVGLARRYNVAIVILHHGKKLDGSYRDSTAIGASVDVLIEMTPDPKDDQARIFTPRARWKIEPFSLRWTGSAYVPASGEVSLQDRVYHYVEQNPGCSKRAIRDNVAGRNSTKDEAIERLIRDRRIEDRGGANGAQYYATIDAIAAFGACPDPPEMATNGARHGHGMGTPPCAPEKPNGALGGHGMGTPSGTPPVPHPLTGVVWGTVEEGAAGGAPEPLPDDPFDWSGPPKKRLDELLGRMTTVAAVEKVRREFGGKA